MSGRSSELYKIRGRNRDNASKIWVMCIKEREMQYEFDLSTPYKVIQFHKGSKLPFD